MNKTLYRFSYRHRIGTEYCVSIQNYTTFYSVAKMISGRKGWICQTGPDRAEAYLVDSSGNEKIFPFEIKYLKTWISRIDVPRKACEKEFYANNPNARHEDKNRG